MLPDLGRLRFRLRFRKCLGKGSFIAFGVRSAHPIKDYEIEGYVPILFE